MKNYLLLLQKILSSPIWILAVLCWLLIKILFILLKKDTSNFITFKEILEYWEM